MSKLLENLCNNHINHLLHSNQLINKEDQQHVFYAAVLSEGYNYAAPLARAYLPDSAIDMSESDLKMSPLSWSKMITLGLHPIAAYDAGVPIYIATFASYKEPPHWINHPLNIALMFARHLGDMNSAKQCVEEYKTIIDDFDNREVKEAANPKTKHRKYQKGSFNKDGLVKSTDCFGSRFWVKSWYCPDPAENGIDFRIDKPHSIFDNVSLASWFSDKGIQEVLVTDAHPIVMAEVLDFQGWRSKQVLLSLSAGRSLRSAIARQGARSDYSNLITLLRLCNRDTADNIMLTTTGVKGMIGIARCDASTQVMSRALSELASHPDHISRLSVHYGRAPTVEELTRVRSSRIINILYYLPMTMLREMLEEERGEELIRARLLRELGNKDLDTTMLRDALSDHEKRPKLSFYPFLNSSPPVAVNSGNETTTHDWDRVFMGLAKQYEAALNYRKQIQELVPNPLFRIAVTLSLYFKNPYLESSFQMQPWWPPVGELLSKMKKPDANLEALIA